MANITERIGKDGTRHYQVQIRLKGHPKLTETFQRLTDARKWAAEKEADIRRGRQFLRLPGERVTLAETIDRYLAECLLDHAESDRATIRQRLVWWRSVFGERTLNSLTPAVLDEGRGLLKQRGIASSTQKRYLRQLGTVLSAAVKWRLIESNPMREIKMPKDNPGRVRFLDRDALPRFLDACRDSDCQGFYAAVLLSLSTGMRRGEMLKLTWDRVDLERGHVILDHPTTKGKVTRGVPLTGEALEVLREHARVRRVDSNLIFPSQDGQKGFDFRRAFAAALKTSGVTNFRGHDLRHTAASYMVMSGASLATVGTLLGHKTLQMPHRYSHLADDFLKAEVERMTTRIFSH